MWNRLPHYVRLVITLTVANLVLLAVRNLIVGDAVYNFLRSNLLSGFIPLVIAYLMMRYYLKINNLVFWIAALLWVLFYPNSPYMISDLIHDDMDTSPAQNLIVFDTLIIFSIAMLSVFYGFLSLKIMFNLFRQRYSLNFARTFITLSLILSCLGFYMGREMKSILNLGNGYLYSWELFLEPIQIIDSVWNILFPIGAHLDDYAMMILFGIVQTMLLVIFKGVGDFEEIGFDVKK